MIVTLIRHGSTAWNQEGRIQGRRDVPLSAHGRSQVAAWRVPSLPADPAIWMSSPLRRAAETAEMLCGNPAQHEDALVEMDWGEWEGLTLTDLRERHGMEFDRNEAQGLDFRPPGGESPRDVLERLRPWLARASAMARPVVAVTHLGVLRVVLAAATEWDMTGKPPIRLQRDTLHRFAVDAGGRISIVECNVPLLAVPDAVAP